MCTTCDLCGARSNEVKSGGGMEELGKKITLNITDPSDMSRDVLKSDTCSIAIPELDFEMGGMSVGGKFTTLEGLLTDILDQVERNSLWSGDAAAPDVAERMKDFKAKFEECIAGKGKFTLILDDPAGNSYVQVNCLDMLKKILQKILFRMFMPLKRTLSSLCCNTQEVLNKTMNLD